MTTPATVTIDVATTGVIIDNTHTPVLVQPGTYTVKSIRRLTKNPDDHLVLIKVPAVPNFYVGVSTEWLITDDTSESLSIQRNKVGKTLSLLVEYNIHADFERMLPYARRLLLQLGGEHAFSGEIAPEPADESICPTCGKSTARSEGWSTGQCDDCYAADNTDSVKSSTVKTWSYSRLNRGGADVTLDLTFEGTDDEWAEHLAELTNQGIEPYNAKITGPVTALGTDFPATPEGFRAAQAEADRMANEENARIAAANRAATDRAPTTVDVIAAAQRRGEAARLQPRAPHLELAEFLVAHPALAAEFINSSPNHNQEGMS